MFLWVILSESSVRCGGNGIYVTCVYWIAGVCSKGEYVWIENNFRLITMMYRQIHPSPTHLRDVVIVIKRDSCHRLLISITNKIDGHGRSRRISILVNFHSLSLPFEPFKHWVNRKG